MALCSGRITADFHISVWRKCLHSVCDKTTFQLNSTFCDISFFKHIINIFFLNQSMPQTYPRRKAVSLCCSYMDIFSSYVFKSVTCSCAISMTFRANWFELAIYKLDYDTKITSLSSAVLNLNILLFSALIPPIDSCMGKRKEWI